MLPNGDVLVAESNKPPQKEESSMGIRRLVAQMVTGSAGANAPSANRISILRDADGDGVAEVKRPFITGLFSPFGMALLNGKLYVANANGIVAFPYQEGATEITAKPEIITDLPAGLNHHWTKDVIASPDGTKLYATVGSNSNVGENGMEAEEGRAAVYEIDPVTRQKRLYATGLRNPNGLSWQPDSGELWVVVNERDEIGSDLVPDYMTSVKDGAFYGWPYSYFGQNVDDRIEPQQPGLVAKAVKPDYALGSHTASLGLTFNSLAAFVFQTLARHTIADAILDAPDGVYYQFCRANGVEFYDFASARRKFLSTQEFSGACQHALSSVSSPQKLFDVILVDEAQDFRPEFLRLCYSALGTPKRLTPTTSFNL